MLRKQLKMWNFKNAPRRLAFADRVTYVFGALDILMQAYYYSSYSYAVCTFSHCWGNYNL